MDDSGLDEIRENFSLTNYNNASAHIHSIQDKYIMSRMRRFWGLPLIVQFAAKRVIFMCTAPEIHIDSIISGKFNICYSQKVMLAGRSLFWAKLLMKRRK